MKSPPKSGSITRTDLYLRESGQKEEIEQLKKKLREEQEEERKMEMLEQERKSQESESRMQQVSRSNGHC